ncbi:MAG: hypothetical protein JXX28_02530 [Deltaproteobacteria bacterium]|nr:hypothetical protein [Deltaproteobacteria bacterium]
MRRLLTFAGVAAAVAVGALWWLHDGDLAEAVAPALVEWDADRLAMDAGVPAEPAPPVPAQAPQP